MLLKFTEYCRPERGGENLLFNFTGDTMLQDDDGHFFFVGRNDDIITSSGYRIGPFDVESVVMEHPAVAEVAVIGKPDPVRTEIVKAVIVLKQGVAGTEALKAEIQNMVRQRLSTHPDGHFKFPHLWPPKLLQAGRPNYRCLGWCGSGHLA